MLTTINDVTVMLIRLFMIEPFASGLRPTDVTPAWMPEYKMAPETIKQVSSTASAT
jgi:hypothetical protein